MEASDKVDEHARGYILKRSIIQRKLPITKTVMLRGKFCSLQVVVSVWIARSTGNRMMLQELQLTSVGCATLNKITK